MFIECEAKFKINNPREFKGLLRRLKARDLGRAKEVDIFLENQTGRVRIRKLNKRGYITYKKSGTNNPQAKVRIELETEVADVSMALAIFKELGFLERGRKEKIRHSFQVGSSVVSLDRLPFLGRFLEIEDSSVKRLQKTAAILKLDYKKACFASYQGLFLDFCVKNGKILSKFENPLTLTFDSENYFRKSLSIHPGESLLKIQ